MEVELAAVVLGSLRNLNSNFNQILFFLFERNSQIHLNEQPLICTADNRVQVLKTNVPFNIILPIGNHLDKRGHLSSPDTTGTVSITSMPAHGIKTESASHGFTVDIPTNGYHAEPVERIVTFDRNVTPDHYSSSSQPPSSQRRTPDTTFSETFKDDVQGVNYFFIRFYFFIVANGKCLDFALAHCSLNFV